MRLVLGEDRQRRELRVARGDEENVQAQQGEEGTVAEDEAVAGCLPAALRLAPPRGDEREQREKGRVGSRVHEKERSERPRARRDRDQARQPAANAETKVRADALQGIAGMASLRWGNRGEQGVVAGPEAAVREPDERRETERVPRLTHEREERERRREQRQRCRECPLCAEAVGGGAARCPGKQCDGR